MAEEKKNTIYQDLNKFFNLGHYGIDEQPVNNNSQQKVIIRGSSPIDLERKALELQQKEALKQKFFRTTDHGFQKAMQYEAARLPAYLDFEGMEYYPIIASALDLFMEEATTIGEDGKMLKISSNKERIQFHLEELFYSRINVNTNLPFWTRNLVKYGDNFLYLMGEKKKGITHVKQMVNYEIERIERINKGKAIVKFKQRQTSDEFNLFEMAHFRMLGDDKYLPYGSSILNKVRRVFRQLIMAEDAMLTYRIVRAGEKRVFKIDVGNIDEDDIEPYIHKVATKFKKQQQVYGDSGQIDYRFNILGNDEDYFIPVRNANVQTGIDTLPGAQNLDQIADIAYLRDNLFTGLGIPKPFLGFQDAAGGGKNMAQMDIRFAKKVNRIQQALIQELNKIAILHLHYLGFEGDDLTNFSLSLTSPSIQQDLLEMELLQQKTQIYEALTRNEGGIAAMSHTNAKRKIFNMSDRDIIQDFKMQRMERAVAQELQDSPLIIRQTGIFDDVDEKYGSGELPPQTGDTGGGMEGEGLPDLNTPPDLGATDAPQSPNELPPVIGQGKGFKDNANVISENGKGIFVKRKKMSKEKFEDAINELVNGDKVETKNKDENKKIIWENESRNRDLTSKAMDMTKEIDALLENSDTVNTHMDIDEKLLVRGKSVLDEIDLNLKPKKE